MILILLLAIADSQTIISVNEDPPFSSCGATASGFEISLLKNALSLRGWTLNKDYVFECSTESTLPVGRIGRVHQDFYKISQGYSYSHPTYNARLTMVSYTEGTLLSAGFLYVFHVTLWIILISAASVIALVIWFFERGTPYIENAFVDGMIQSIWALVCAFYMSGAKTITRCHTRILFYFMFLFFFMVFSLYFAASIDNYFHMYKFKQIPEDLRDLTYVADPVYLDYLSRFEGRSLSMEVSTSHYTSPVDKLEDEKADVIVTDYYQAHYIAEEDDQVSISGFPIVSVIFAVEFYPNATETLLTAVNKGLAQYTRTYDYVRLLEEFFDTDEKTVKAWNIEQLSVFHVSNIMIFFGVCVLIVFVIRSFAKKNEVKMEKTYHKNAVKLVTQRPATRILEPTTKFVEHNEVKTKALFNRLEKLLKAHTISVERLNKNINLSRPR